jgi:hypothetical protein
VKFEAHSSNPALAPKLASVSYQKQVYVYVRSAKVPLPSSFEAAQQVNTTEFGLQQGYLISTYALQYSLCRFIVEIESGDCVTYRCD